MIRYFTISLFLVTSGLLLLAFGTYYLIVGAPSNLSGIAIAAVGGVALFSQVADYVAIFWGTLLASGKQLLLVPGTNVFQLRVTESGQMRRLIVLFSRSPHCFVGCIESRLNGVAIASEQFARRNPRAGSIRTAGTGHFPVILKARCGLVIGDCLELSITIERNKDVCESSFNQEHVRVFARGRPEADKSG